MPIKRQDRLDNKKNGDTIEITLFSETPDRIIEKQYIYIYVYMC